MTWVNIGCGPFRAPEPWINADVNADNNPDVLLCADHYTWPWDDASVTRVYLGHVMEHVPWERVGDFLGEVKRVMVPGAEVMIVGPDVLRTIQRWHDGDEDWHNIIEQIEDDHDYQSWADGGVPWLGLRHCWNAYEARIARMLDRHGFTDITPREIAEDALAAWPVVAFTQTQCAVYALRPHD